MEAGSQKSVWVRQEIESPCVQICIIHPETRLCAGCARSIDEISEWSRMSANQRAEIMEKLPGREPAPKTRRGGRSARLKR
ncbi:MAG: DUF1289 domain-containing protein [Tateyamaria sp.]|jgi:predicted Fe-S protein YdhL (DUF1289 family)|nr:DUF1289 domain-containing protein [Tateyamaria sp.]MBT5302776.1 DUF1289 domain-containing protein [Tateyamaria sp.]MBT6268673.1 DUF1289 domain-containing protein [Tateyamaria sp.]MBT6343086.1 DUF1289 domain-containing protein [Tateyamaria sp.]MBT7448255.1 DUF1289 domain-containing protein [Tateyamaria sp.]